MRNIRYKVLAEAVRRAVREDHVFRDSTTNTLFKTCKKIEAFVVARQSCVLAGSIVVPILFREFERRVNIKSFYKDGDKLKAGSKVIKLTGDAKVLFAAERTMLNFIGHLSGIATHTNLYAEAVSGTNAKIYDTRKTTPGLRELEKYAVRCGGGVNHRFNLEEMALVKDNHLAESSFDDLESAVKSWRRKGLRVEIEADSMELLENTIKLRPDIILLDNFDYKGLKKAVSYARSGCKALLEVSGNVKLENVRKIARLGIDRISVGAITHSSANADFSLEVY